VETNVWLGCDTSDVLVDGYTMEYCGGVQVYYIETYFCGFEVVPHI